MYSEHALQVLTFLVPGLLSSKVLNSLIHRKEKGEFEKLVEALIFSLIIYATFALLFKNSIISVATVSEVYGKPKMLISLLVISIILPSIISLLVANNLMMYIPEKLKITKNTSRSSTWLDVFYDMKQHSIIINFANGRRIWGWAVYYSNEPDDAYIYLHQPRWVIINEDGTTSYSAPLGDGVLITPEQKIEFIEFYPK